MGANTPGEIKVLAMPVAPANLRGLAELLVDAVAGGDAVSFVSPFSVEDAERWWRGIFDAAGERSVFLVARDAERIVGSVQLHPAWAPNQPHRAEVSKLLVHRRARRRGLGRRLMAAIELAAEEAGFRLLTLDAKRGGAAEQLYRQTGWIEVGSIPRFAVDPDGATFHDAVIFYKGLGAGSKQLY